ncbi:MAG: translesion error-prone DNA polymerase V autoproteolytic subunit [Oligoflexia bacterium]|nr:translesion error-prone DNA polymerase V autoproteolytic subunit [Oligoflexia bacterium]
MQSTLKVIPLFSSTISCGFPSPADDYVEKDLSLDEHLIKYPESTFFVRAQGDSMSPAILDGDLLIVDRSLTATSGKIILGILDGEFVAKYFFYRDGRPILKAANTKYKEILIKEENNFQVWGVVTYIIHKVY